MNSRRTLAIISLVELAIIITLILYTIGDKRRDSSFELGDINEEASFSMVPEEYNEYLRYLYEKRIRESKQMSFSHIGEQQIDGLEEKWALIHVSYTTPDTNLLWWEELPGSEDVTTFEYNYGINVPLLDLETQSIIVSFERKVELLRVYKDEHYYPSNNNLVACVTFSENHYDNVVFFYSITRQSETDFVFVPSGLSAPCFIIDKEERYLGTTLPIHYPK